MTYRSITTVSIHNIDVMAIEAPVSCLTLMRERALIQAANPTTTWADPDLEALLAR